MAYFKQFRIPKTTMFLLTFLCVGLLIETYFSYYQTMKSCAQSVLALQFGVLIIQLALNYFNYQTSKKRVLTLTLIISVFNFIGLLYSFLHFRTLCEIYGL